MSSNLALLYKFIIYNILWFVVAFTAQSPFELVLLCGAVLLLTISFRQKTLAEILLLFGFGLSGLGFDWLTQYFKVVQFKGMGLFLLPYWLWSLWILFLWILPDIFVRFKSSPFVFALLGAIAGPLSYASGVQFGVLDLNLALFIPSYVFFWGIILPLQQKIYLRFWRVYATAK